MILNAKQAVDFCKTEVVCTSSFITLLKLANILRRRDDNQFHLDVIANQPIAFHLGSSPDSKIIAHGVTFDFDWQGHLYFARENGEIIFIPTCDSAVNEISARLNGTFVEEESEKE